MENQPALFLEFQNILADMKKSAEFIAFEESFPKVTDCGENRCLKFNLKILNNRTYLPSIPYVEVFVQGNNGSLIGVDILFSCKANLKGHIEVKFVLIGQIEEKLAQHNLKYDKENTDFFLCVSFKDCSEGVFSPPFKIFSRLNEENRKRKRTAETPSIATDIGQGELFVVDLATESSTTKVLRPGIDIPPPKPKRTKKIFKQQSFSTPFT